MSVQIPVAMAGLLRVLFFISVASALIAFVLATVTGIYDGPGDDVARRVSSTFVNEGEDEYNRNLGLIYSRGKKPQEAVRLFERALAAEPAMVEVHLNRGIALCELGRRGEAAGAFDRYVTALPEGNQKRKAVQEMIGRLTGR